MKKLLYIGHEYHLKTKSTSFLIDLFREKYDVDMVAYDPYLNQFDQEIENDGKAESYELLVCFQVVPDRKFIDKNFRYKTGVIFPMYDHYINNPMENLPDFRDFKFINFSSTLHQELIGKGYNSYYIQYFPKPYKNFGWGNERSLFFWQRLQYINFKTVETLLSGYKLDKFHIHKAMDPLQKFVEPEGQLENIITYSEWFENSSDKDRLIEESALYMAPRIYEGIGMSFLEAMAMGRCVIAPDHPTMNEYIKNGITGYLYDYNNVEQIELTDIRKIQENAYQYILDGYQKWEQEKYKIFEWMLEERIQPRVTIVTVTYNIIENGRKDSMKQCMESVFRQSYGNIEHLVIDGASTDGTIDILKKYEQKGWIKYYSESDDGMYQAMNRGIARAEGKYIAFLNTDDYYHNRDAVSESVRFLENSQADFSYASNRIVNSNNRCLAIRKPQIGSYVAQMPFCHQTMFTKKEVLMNFGMFDERYKSAADYDLVVRLMLEGRRYVEVPFIIVSYRIGGVSESNQKRSDQEKKQIFCENYGKINDIYQDMRFASRLAGRICPNSLYKDLEKVVPAALYQKMQEAVVSYDDLDDTMILPQEIIKTDNYMDSAKISEIVILEKCSKTDIMELIFNIGLQDYQGKELVIVNRKIEPLCPEITEKQIEGLDVVYIAEGYDDLQDAVRKGVQAASGEVLHFMTIQDRYMEASALASIAEYIKNTQTDVVSIEPVQSGRIYLDCPIQNFYIRTELFLESNVISMLSETNLSFAIKLCMSLTGTEIKNLTMDGLIISDNEIYRSNQNMDKIAVDKVKECVGDSYDLKQDKRSAENIPLKDSNGQPDRMLINQIDELNKEKERYKARAEKFYNYFRILNHWIWLKNSGRCVEEYFTAQGYSKIAVYGIGELGTRLYEDLKESKDVCIEYAIESEKGKNPTYLDILTVEDELLPVDAVVVTPIFAFEAIKQKLLQKISCPIISLYEVILDI